MGIEAIGQTAWAIMTALLAKDKSAMGQTLSKYPHKHKIHENRDLCLTFTLLVIIISTNNEFRD